MNETLVLGGDGFIGSALRDRVSSTDFVFASRVPTSRQGRVRTIQLNLLDKVALAQASEFDHAIWVAGGSDHSLGSKDPRGELELQVVALLNFLEHFRGSLTLLSSQATYYGLSGEIAEDVDHVPDMPYGFAKLAAEKYARWALQAGRLRRLWVHRLMYAYGANESPRRLVARCTQASLDGSRVIVTGEGRSFLNPLPVHFVAEVLLRTTDHLKTASVGALEVTNLNHPERWTVLDVVETLSDISGFEYQLSKEGERWPVTFYGSVVMLSRWLERWDLRFPDIRSSLTEYADRALAGDVA